MSGLGSEPATPDTRAGRLNVMVCGSREWSDVDTLTLRLLDLPGNAVLLHGGAVGADQIASSVATSTGIPQRAFLPDYSRYGKSAPHVRNDEMVALADLVLAFWDGRSPGTRSVIRKAEDRLIPVEIIAPRESPVGSSQP